MNDKTNLEVIQQAFEHIARAASAAPISMGKMILQGQTEDERLSLLHDLAKRLKASEADRAQREESDDIIVTRYRGEQDNVPVIQVETEGDVGEIRIRLNDHVLYGGVPEHDEPSDGTIHAAVIDALRERRIMLDTDADSYLALQAAEDWVNDWPDAFWDEFAGPMLDEIERRFHTREED